MATKVPLHTMRHPEYLVQLKDWDKWRRVYAAGDEFIQYYLEKFSTRELNTDFAIRKAITPIPAFAKAAVNDVKNSIFQRMVDIERQGGSKTYQSAMQGLANGVDLRGSAMNSFIGQEVLPELLTMSRVGVYVDMPQLPNGASLATAETLRPYLYMYRTEDILSWSCCGADQPDQFKAILLRDRCIDYDPISQLAFAEVERYRYIWVSPETGKVNVQFFSKEGQAVDITGQPAGAIELSLTTIPFVMFDIKQSLIEDVANHQIALLNLGSSDVAYALKSNFPFYVEQQDLRSGSSHLLENMSPDASATAGSQQGRDMEVQVGPVNGRVYDLKANEPGFIHPSPEPLEASMKLQEKLKEDIRLLVNLAVTNVNPKMASAESKQLDMAGLESGLSYIGLVLENGERRIARFWSLYETGKDTEAAAVTYPENYSLKSDAQRIEEAKSCNELKFSVPSKTFQKKVNELVTQILLGTKCTPAELETVIREIATADHQTSDPDIIEKDLTAGLVGSETASLARGYAPGEVQKAKKDHAERLALIQEHQTPPGGEANGARGIKDKAVTAGESKAEKEGKPQRGEGTKLDKETKDE